MQEDVNEIVLYIKKIYLTTFTNTISLLLQIQQI